MGIQKISNGVKKIVVSLNQKEIQKVLDTFPSLILANELITTLKKPAITFNELISLLQELEKASTEANENIINQLITSIFNALKNVTQNNLAKESANELINLFEALVVLEEKAIQERKKEWRKHIQQLCKAIFNQNNEATYLLLNALQKKIATFKKAPVEETSELKTKSTPIDFKRVGIYIALIFLAGMGLLKGATEGFNGINSLISIIPGLSGTPLALAFCIGFIGVSVLIYIAFDFRNILSALGIKTLDARITTTDCLEQAEQLENTYTEINQILRKQTFDSFDHYQKIVDELIQELKEKKNILVKKLPNWILKAITKGIIFTLGGILFLCSGFFGGQSFFMTILGLPAVSPVIITLSAMVAVGFFASYAVIEGSQSSKFIDVLFGVSEESLEKIDDSLKKLEEKQQETNDLLNLQKRPFVVESPLEENLNSKPVTSQPSETASDFDPLKKIPDGVPVLPPAILTATSTFTS